MMVDYSKWIVSPDQNYKGMSYGDWVARWTNWLFSEEPERNEVQRDVVFLRGNVEYYHDLAKASERGGSVNPWEPFYNRTGVASVIISDDTPVLVPALTSTKVFGGGSEFGTMDTEEQVRRVARIDNDESGAIWATIESSDNKSSGAHGEQSLLPSVENGEHDLRKYRITSNVFKLWISEANQFWKNIFQYPINSGEHHAVTEGFFILLRSLPEGSYRLRFGGKGRGNYRTESVYDLHVSAECRRVSTVTDISSKPKGESIWLLSSGRPHRDIDKLQSFTGSRKTQ